MNYPNLPQSRQRPPRKSNFVLLLIMGFMAFFLFSQYKKSQVNRTGDVADFSIPDISNDGEKSDGVAAVVVERDHNGVRIGTAPSGNDWELDTDVPIDNDNTSFVIGSERGTPTERTESGDWEMEVAASQESDGGTAVQAPPQVKTTKKDGWELGEVEVEKVEQR